MMVMMAKSRSINDDTCDDHGAFFVARRMVAIIICYLYGVNVCFLCPMFVCPFNVLMVEVFNKRRRMVESCLCYLSLALPLMPPERPCCYLHAKERRFRAWKVEQRDEDDDEAGWFCHQPKRGWWIQAFETTASSEVCMPIFFTAPWDLGDYY